MQAGEPGLRSRLRYPLLKELTAGVLVEELRLYLGSCPGLGEGTQAAVSGVGQQ